MLKMGDNFILTHIRSFDLSSNEEEGTQNIYGIGWGLILVQHDKLSCKPADQCTAIMGVLFQSHSLLAIQ